MSSKKVKAKSSDNRQLLHRCEVCDVVFFVTRLNEHKSTCGSVSSNNFSFIRNREIFANLIKTALPVDLHQFKDKVSLSSLIESR